MLWPSQILEAFSDSLDIELFSGDTKQGMIQYMLDETARRAVWRAKADPKRLNDAYQVPYTPLGSVSVGGLAVKSLKFKDMEKWSEAVDGLYCFVAENTELICKDFESQQVAYDDCSN